MKTNNSVCKPLVKLLLYESFVIESLGFSVGSKDDDIVMSGSVGSRPEKGRKE
jgi:hypothetical protein